MTSALRPSDLAANEEISSRFLVPALMTAGDTVRRALLDAGFGHTPEMYGALGDGVTDDAVALNNYAAGCGRLKCAVRLTDGKIYAVGSAFRLPNGVGFAYTTAVIKVLPSFVGEGGVKAVIWPADEYVANVLFAPTVDCNSVAGVQAYRFSWQSQRVTVYRPTAYRCATTALYVQKNPSGPSGYEMKFFDIDLYGACPHSRFAGTLGVMEADAPGVYIGSTDSETTGKIAHFNRGLENRGGRNKGDVHVWSSYYADDNPMYIGVDVAEGSMSDYSKSHADGIRTKTNAPGTVPSLSEGGYGVVVRAGLTGVKVDNFQLTVPAVGDAQPVASSVVPSYIGTDFGISFEGARVNQSGAVVAKLFDVATTAALRNSNIRNFFPTNLATQLEYRPSSASATSSVIAVAGTAITDLAVYQDNIANNGRVSSFERSGASWQFVIRIALKSLSGVGTGAVTIPQLPMTGFANGDQIFPCILWNTSKTGAILRLTAVLTRNTNVLTLYKDDGSQLQVSDLTATSSLSISGIAGYALNSV